MAREIRPSPLPVPRPRGIEPLPVVSADNVIPHIEGERFWVDRDGPHAIQVAQVSGLHGNPASRLYGATLAPGIPRYGQFHKVVPFLPVTNVEAVYADPGTSDIAIITITYGFAPAGVGSTTYFTNEPSETALPQVEILTTVQPARTEFELDADNNRQPITVSYIDTSGVTSRAVTQGGSVEYPLVMETVRYMRREPRDPRDKNKLYVGHMNSPGVFGDPPDMWLCTRLDGVSDDGGATSNVTYEFQRNPDSWNPYIAPTDPETRERRVLTPDDLALPDGARNVRILRRADFWLLNLTLPGQP